MHRAAATGALRAPVAHSPWQHAGRQQACVAFAPRAVCPPLGAGVREQHRAVLHPAATVPVQAQARHPKTALPARDHHCAGAQRPPRAGGARRAGAADAPGASKGQHYSDNPIGGCRRRAARGGGFCAEACAAARLASLWASNSRWARWRCREASARASKRAARPAAAAA